jgi:hypothetical protein
MIRRAIAIAGTALAALAVMATAAHASDPRAATLVGAAEAPYTVAGWEAGNDAIGPLQTQRIFYSGALPATYSGSYCHQLQSANPRSGRSPPPALISYTAWSHGGYGPGR